MKNSALNKLQALCAANALPHAWLLVGTNAAENLSTALELSQWLLCAEATTSQRACGHCKACNLFAANTHPDFCKIAPAADKQSIAVADVRVIADIRHGAKTWIWISW